MHQLICVLAMVFSVVSSPVLALLQQGTPAVGGVALVISAPWGTSLDNIMVDAGVPEAFPKRAPIGAFVVINQVDDISALYRQGAVLVINGEKVLALC